MSVHSRIFSLFIIHNAFCVWWWVFRFFFFARTCTWSMGTLLHSLLYLTLLCARCCSAIVKYSFPAFTASTLRVLFCADAFFPLVQKVKAFQIENNCRHVHVIFLCVRSMCCTALKFTQNLCISLSLSLSLSLSRSVDGFEVFINNDTHIQSFSAVSLPNYKQRNKKNITVKREILCFVWFTLSN